MRIIPLIYVIELTLNMGFVGDLGLDARDMQFFYSSAQIQMLYAHLFHHCIALRNLHTVADAKALRPEVSIPFYNLRMMRG